MLGRMLVTRTIYSLYYPETRQIVDALWAERPHGFYERPHEKRQDAMHGPFLDRWRAWSAEAGVVMGDGFGSEYPTAGASEGIWALISHVATSSKCAARVHVFEGEYEGFKYMAEAAHIEVVTHFRDPDRYRVSLREGAREGDWFLLSQPSAIDGCVWEGFDAFLDAVEGTPLRVAVDLTYVGAVARDYRIVLDRPSVHVVLASLSKPFGVYYHRVGALFSRAPVLSLHGNLWFKNLFSIALGERLMRAHGAHDLPSRYQDAQRSAVQRAVDEGACPPDAVPSDVVLVAHARRTGRGEDEYLRAQEPEEHVLRYCLTPAIDQALS